MVLTVVRHEAHPRTEMVEADRHREMGREDIHVVRTQTETVMMEYRLAESIRGTKLIPHHTVVGEVEEQPARRRGRDGEDRVRTTSKLPDILVSVTRGNLPGIQTSKQNR